MTRKTAMLFALLGLCSCGGARAPASDPEPAPASVGGAAPADEESAMDGDGEAAFDIEE